MSDSKRIIRVLTRVSRDKWLSGDEVRRIELAMARKTRTGNIGATLSQVGRDIPGASLIGLIRGKTPISFGHYEFQNAAQKINRANNTKPHTTEFVILQIQLKNLRTYGWT